MGRGTSLLSTTSRRRVLRGAIVLAAVTALSSAGAAQARQPRTLEATAPRETGEPIMAIVSIKSQQVTFYDAEGWTHRASISSGIRGRETPAGVFAIVQKNADHRSNLYDDAWMPHMQRLTWNGIALHGGQLPGYPASKGCVRMPFGFAEKLFEKTRIGMRVIVSPNDTAPVDISHPALLVPKAEAATAAPSRAEKLEREAAEAARAEDDAKKAAAKAARDTASLRASLRRLEDLKKRADSELASAVRAIAAANTDQKRSRAEEQKLKAETKAEQARAQLETATAEAKSKLDEAAKAVDAAKAAATRKADLSKTAKDAKLAAQPVSVYVSRATQRLYVRRNTQKPWPDGGEVFDSSIEAPITIRNPDKPIGTHIFTAVARDGGGLRWTAVTIDSRDDAKSALDRISIPQDVLDRIAPTAVPRSSIVISDEPLSKETNYRTEFVAVLSNQPQGGFVTRKPTVAPAFPMASATTGGGGFWFFEQPSAARQVSDRRRRGGDREVQKKEWWW